MIQIPQVIEELAYDLMTGTPHSYDGDDISLLDNSLTLLYTLHQMGYNFARICKNNTEGQVTEYQLYCISPDGVHYNSSSNRYNVNGEHRAQIADKFITHIWVTYHNTVSANMKKHVEQRKVQPKMKDNYYARLPRKT